MVAILDWYARYVVAWQLSSTLDSTFCSATLQQALTIAQPDIQISMDHRGRCFDNIFTERLWRTVKYEEVYLKEYTSFSDAEHSLQTYFHTYNHDRLHSALKYKTPAEVYFAD